MQRALFLIVGKDEKITLVPPHMQCCRDKEDNLQEAFFAGARMPFTAFTLSSGVPTSSSGYSINAHGINRDIFGNPDCPLETMYLDVVAAVDRISFMLDETTPIRRGLAERIPKVQREEPKAGIVLEQLLGEN